MVKLKKRKQKNIVKNTLNFVIRCATFACTLVRHFRLHLTHNFNNTAPPQKKELKTTENIR
jgi:hypothetical protein